MRKLALFHKILYGLNILMALLLLAASAVPYISDVRFAFLSFLSLTVPVLVAVNALFFLYWLSKRKKQLWVSLTVLVLGYISLGTFVRFNFQEEYSENEGLKVMSYNVRGFNKYGELDNPKVFEDIKAFIDKEQPDIICFQEPHYKRKKEYLKDYPYQYLEYIGMKGKVLLGFFSKYPIIKSDLIDFPRTVNNGAYADILYRNDTIRVYNVHMQSLGVTPGSRIIRNTSKDKLFKKVARRFRLQQQQAKLVAKHMESNTYKQILCGDFNNTQFSNTYKTIKGDKQDTFIEKGNGYGRTLNFHGIPVRIDFILADPEFEVLGHKNYDVVYSDHYPVMATFRLKSD